MPTIKLQLDQGGAVVDLRVGLSTSAAKGLRQRKESLPIPVPAKGLLDTGSVFSCIDYHIADELGLIHPTGKQEVRTLRHQEEPIELDVFEMSLTLVHPKLPRGRLRIARSLPVLCGNVKALGEDVLLGQDVLKRLRFIYNGKEGTFSLTVDKD
jgi:hypothetical protein